MKELLKRHHQAYFGVVFILIAVLIDVKGVPVFIKDYTVVLYGRFLSDAQLQSVFEWMGLRLYWTFFAIGSFLVIKWVLSYQKNK